MQEDLEMEDRDEGFTVKSFGGKAEAGQIPDVQKTQLSSSNLNDPVKVSVEKEPLKSQDPMSPEHYSSAREYAEAMRAMFPAAVNCISWEESWELHQHLKHNPTVLETTTPKVMLEAGLKFDTGTSEIETHMSAIKNFTSNLAINVPTKMPALSR